MAITTSLNLINQNQTFTNELKEYFENQLSPLANAGQRFGIAADGISYKSFSAKDIFPNTYSLTNDIIDNYILKVNFNNDKTVKMTLVNKETGAENTELIQNTETSKVFYLSNNTDIVNLISYIINNIEEYQSDSLLITEDNIFTCILKGKYVNSNDADDGEIFYFQYDIETNRLLHFIDSKPYDGLINDNHNKLYIIYKLDYVDEEEYSLSIHLYTLEAVADIIYDIYSFDSTNETEITNFKNNVVDLLKNLYTYNIPIFSEPDNDNSKPIRSFSPFNVIYKDYNLLINNDITINGNLGDVNIFQLVLNYDETNEDDLQKINIHHFNNIKVNYKNTEDETYFNIDQSSADYKKIIGYISYEDLNEFIYITSNINLLYIKLLNYYNQNYYNLDQSTLYKRIFIALYNKIRSEEHLLNYENDVMYIPLDYNIHYICNSNNMLNIFYSNNIYVTFTNDVLINNYISNVKDMIIYYNQYCVNHSVIYNFEFEYNKTYTDIITNLRIVKLYSLPYINSLNNWVINDVDSNTSAVTDINNGFKIIYIYSDADKYSIINMSDVISDNNDSIYNKFTCEKKSFLVNPNLFSAYNDRNIYCNAWIPKIENNKEFFEKTLIISISSKNSIINDKTYKDYYIFDYVYALWTVTNEDNILKYTYVKDFNSLNSAHQYEYAYDPYSNINNVIAQYINNSKVIALKTNAQNYKQNSYYSEDNSWLVYRNKSAADYDGIEYNNDYNVIIEFVNQLNKTGDNVNYDIISKYLSDLSSVSVTNSIYPRYIYTKEKIISKETLRKTYQQLVSNFESYDLILINGQEVTSENQLLESIDYITAVEDDKESVNYVIITIKGDKDKSKCYEEYVFNTNVPTVDFKEVFIRNSNVLNRQNILSLSEDGVIYNGYIGSSYNDSDKSIMHISGSNMNINIGTDTLLNSSETNKFTPYNKLYLDNFDTIYLNPNNTIKLGKNPIIYRNNGDYTCSVVPYGIMDTIKIPIKIKKVQNIESLTDNNFIILFTYDSLNNSSVLKDLNNNYIFYRFYLDWDGTYLNDPDKNKNIELFDAIYLNKLIYQLTGENIGNVSFDQFKKTKNIIFNIPDDQGINHFFLMINSKELDYNYQVDLTQSLNHNLIISKYFNNLKTIFNISFDDSIINNVLLGDHLIEFIDENVIQQSLHNYALSPQSEADIYEKLLFFKSFIIRLYNVSSYLQENGTNLYFVVDSNQYDGITADTDIDTIGNDLLNTDTTNNTQNNIIQAEQSLNDKILNSNQFIADNGQYLIASGSKIDNLLINSSAGSSISSLFLNQHIPNNNTSFSHYYNINNDNNNNNNNYTYTYTYI